MSLIRPRRLKRGDKLAVVSLSSGMLGEEKFEHKLRLAQERMGERFGVELVAMPHALKGIEYIYEHPEKRAEDLMAAFEDETVSGVIGAIGGNDSIRILPYINYEVIRENPKVFMGFSDTTVTHFIMRKAGVASFYGPSVMAGLSEYGGSNFEYTMRAVEKVLFEGEAGFEVESSAEWTKDFVPWGEENVERRKEMEEEKHGYEVLQGGGLVRGELIGGCIDIFPMCVGTEIWPELEEWRGKILLVETSDERVEPVVLAEYLRNLGAQGILGVLKGVVVGKPQAEQYYEEYKEEAWRKVLREYGLSDLPVMYNLNVGHAEPVGVLPLGMEVEVDYDRKSLKLIESL